MTSSLGFNKPESANFIFECVQYLMPEEGWVGTLPVKGCEAVQEPFFFFFIYLFNYLQGQTSQHFGKRGTVEKTAASKV